MLVIKLTRRLLTILQNTARIVKKYRKSPGRYKFTLKKDVNFNYSILIDIMYIDINLIFHIINEATRF